MPAVLLAALRTGAQALVGAIVTWLTAKGFDLPLETQHWLVEVVLVGAGITVYTVVVRWLETSDVAAFRWLARLLMLGLGGKQPVYAKPTAEVVELRPNGQFRALR
jgi:hypothetical protein